MAHILRRTSVLKWFLRSTGRFSRWWPILATVGVGLTLTIGVLALMQHWAAHWLLWSVFVVGLAATCFAAAYTWLIATGHERSEQLLAEQAREIRAKSEQLQRSGIRIRELRISHEDTIHQLLKAALHRNQETGMHLKRVGLLSEVLALAAGWSPFDAQTIRMAAPMHDVGMIGVPDAIVQKPGKLTPAEFEIVKTHTLIGARMLEGSHSEILAMAHKIAQYHHERWDGTGYPYKLSGQTIPEPARIVCIVDVFDAVSHNRVWRPALSPQEIRDILTKGAGTQFDPNLVNLFMAHYETASNIARENPDEVMVGFGTSYFVSPAPIVAPIVSAMPDVASA
jgi:response regulator RpfG family c-di-GMP phosphodiesterase